MKLISFVFSFRNEEKNLKNLVDRVDKAVKKTENWNYELIFVNDDSTDNSEKILLDLQKQFPIKIINMSRRFGTNPCVLAGFENCSGDCIIYMDSDLQDPPELITELIKQHEKGFDIVHTKRTKRLGEPRSKLFFTNLAYAIIDKLSDINLEKSLVENSFPFSSSKITKSLLLIFFKIRFDSDFLFLFFNPIEL